jgi:hypothetical protein
MPWNEEREEGFIVRDGRCGGRCSGMWLVKTLGRKICQDLGNGWLSIAAQTGAVT